MKIINILNFIIIYLITLLAIYVIISSNNFVLLYLALELQSISFYLLATIKYDNILSAESGLKYSIQGSFAAGFLTFGSALLYGLNGSTNLIEIYNFLLDINYNNIFSDSMLTLSITLIIMGMLFKVSAVPFHVWTFDVYEGAPIIATMFFATIGKYIGVILTIKFLYEIFISVKGFWLFILLYAAIASLIVGSFGALTQNNFKRLLAYSSITNIGFILLGCTVNPNQAVYCIISYLNIYILITICIFMLIISIREIGNYKYLHNINDYMKITQDNSIISLLFFFQLLSIAGIPPLSGFYVKMNILLMIIIHNYYFFAFIITTISIIIAYYYIRIIEYIYFYKTLSRRNINIQNKFICYFIIIITLINIFLILFSGTYSIIIMNFIKNYAI